MRRPRSRSTAGRTVSGGCLSARWWWSTPFPADDDVELLVDEQDLIAGALQRERQPIVAEVTLSAVRVAADLARVRVVVRNVSAFQRRRRPRPRAGVTVVAGLDARDPHCGARRLALARGPAHRRGRSSRGLSQCRPLAGAGRRAGRGGHRACVADHPRGPSRRSPQNPPATSSTQPRSTRSSACESSPSPTTRRPRCGLPTARARALLDRTEALTGRRPDAACTARSARSVRSSEIGDEQLRPRRLGSGGHRWHDRVGALGRRPAPSRRPCPHPAAAARRHHGHRALRPDRRRRIHRTRLRGCRPRGALVDDDPGKDLGALRQPGHRFFFALDDLERLEPSEVQP